MGYIGITQFYPWVKLTVLPSFTQFYPTGFTHWVKRTRQPQAHTLMLVIINYKLPTCLHAAASAAAAPAA